MLYPERDGLVAYGADYSPADHGESMAAQGRRFDNGPANGRNRRISLKKSAAESGGCFDRVRAREADSSTPELVLALE